MSDARETVLARVREALGRGASEAADTVARERIGLHARHIEPAFDEKLAQRFQRKLEAAEASVAWLDDFSAVGAEVERYLAEKGLDGALLVSGDALLQSIAWPKSLGPQQRVATGDDRIAVTGALCGIAETGTLMLVSGAGRPTSLNFLPDYHLIVLEVKQLLPRMEDAWDLLRAEFDAMPRTVNFISGPSKTADVEQTVEYGAHGPRCLHVILVEQTD